MPIVRPCQHVGCPEYAVPGSSLCSAHRSAYQAGVKRRTTGRSFYNSARWQAARRRQLREHPDCAECGRLATQVDHIRPLRSGGAEVDPSNLQSLCAKHHSAKTAREVWHAPKPQ